MSFKIRTATEADRPAVNALARKSPWTRDFANPPLSLKAMCSVALLQGEVHVAENENGALLGFVWCRPMKPKHMPFSTIYYMGVDPNVVRVGVGKALFMFATIYAKEGRIELVCEDGNRQAHAFYRKMRMKVLSKGVVGKDARPYTRFYTENPL